MNREFTTVIDMVGRTCIRRCDNERFIFLFPKDNSCKEFIMYNMNKFNQHKGFIPDTPVMLPTIIKEENFVPGCQSSVWVTHEYTDNTLQYFAHSDSKLVKGLLHILTEAFSGYHPNDMLQFNTASIQKIPLGAQLSMQRQIGMMSVFKRFQQIAKQYTASA